MTRPSTAATRIACGLASAGAAGLLLATPAQAKGVPDPHPLNRPGTGVVMIRTELVEVPPDGIQVAQVALGALGGIVVVGAATTVVVSVRSHHLHLPHAS